jgi:hypothetical protein
VEDAKQEFDMSRFFYIILLSAFERKDKAAKINPYIRSTKSANYGFHTALQLDKPRPEMGLFSPINLQPVW